MQKTNHSIYSKRKTVLPSVAFTDAKINTTQVPNISSGPVDQHKALEMVARMQEKMFDKVRRSEKRYGEALQRIHDDLSSLKKRSNFIRLENGQTTEEYLAYRARIDHLDKRKRLDALTLLNRFGQSVVTNNYALDFYFHDYPRSRNTNKRFQDRLYPLYH